MQPKQFVTTLNASHRTYSETVSGGWRGKNRSL